MESIYSLRKNFTVVGLTGTLGGGCTEVAKNLSSSKEDFFQSSKLRKPSKIATLHQEDIEEYEKIIFQRKYKICYDFLSKNWNKFEIIDYKKVLFLYCFDYFINVKKSMNFEIVFAEFIINNFKKSEFHDIDFNDSDKKISKEEIINIFSQFS